MQYTVYKTADGEGSIIFTLTRSETTQLRNLLTSLIKSARLDLGLQLPINDLTKLKMQMCFPLSKEALKSKSSSTRKAAKTATK